MWFDKSGKKRIWKKVCLFGKSKVFKESQKKRNKVKSWKCLKILKVKKVESKKLKVFCLFLVFWCLEKIWMSKKEKCWKEKSNLRKKCYKKKVEKRCLEKSVIKKSLLSVIKSVEKSKSVEKKSRIYFWNLFWIFEFWIFLCFLSLKESQKSLSRWKKLLKILKVFWESMKIFFDDDVFWWWEYFCNFFDCEKFVKSEKRIFLQFWLSISFWLSWLSWLSFCNFSWQFFFTIFIIFFFFFRESHYPPNV